MFRKPAHPFLLLITNSHESQWYKVENETRMIELNTLVDEKAHFSDKEGRSNKGTTTGGNLRTNEAWTEETQKHLKKACEKTRELWSTDAYEDLVITAPENLKNQLTEELNLPNVKNFYIPGNFTHTNLHHKLLERINEGLE